MLQKLPFPHPIHLLLLILVLYSYVCSCHQVCDHQDQSALLDFSANISASPPSLPLNWSSGVSCCRWEGVRCDLNGRVTHLQLPSRSLKGVILISSISNIVMLTHLNLSNNYLHGSIGEDITRLTNLKIIDLSINSILGSIPQEIGQLLYLEKLHLNENNLSGHIPSSLMNCTRIVEIILRYNNLRGEISTLEFSKLVQLQKLDLKANSLSGPLPKSIYSCKSLIAIRVSENNINGQISPKIVELKSLSFISLSNNSLTNITMTLRVLAKCKNLTTLFLASNFYGESLPVHKTFIMSSEFPKIQFFSLANCNFEEGPIPKWLSTLKSLRVLKLSNNRLTDRVPNWLGTLPNLFTLDLSGNSLDGVLPLKLWQLPALMLENAQTDLNCSQFELLVCFEHNNNSMLGFIRFKDNYYRAIILSNNALSGDIPEEVGSLRNLQRLHLDNNQFFGQIPTSISNLRKLERLDVSRNNFIGEIPASLASLSFLSYFNVSYNDLGGPIPTGGQFGSFEQSEFKGNPNLCGEPLNNPCSSPPTFLRMNRSESQDNLKQFMHGLFVGFVSAFSIVLVFIAPRTWYHNFKRFQPSSRRR